MAEPDGQTDEVVQGIKRALDAADAANEAAADIASLQAAYRSFAESVIRTQRRNTLFASGAAAGAMVAIAMAGVVYFRSVEDLRIASAVQSDAAALLVDELTQLDKIGDTVTEQQDVMKADLLELLEKVKDEIRRAAMEREAPQEAAAEPAPMDAQVATAIREGVKADLDAVRDQLLTAIAELRVGGGEADTAELTALVAELKAVMDGGGKVDAKPAEAPAPAAAPRPSKPKPKPAPEPDPFTYP